MSWQLAVNLLLDWQQRPYVSLLVEVGFNALTPLVVLGAWLMRMERKRALGLSLLAAASGVGLDLDHALAASSFQLEAMLGLGARPFSHSLSFALAASLMAWALSRRRDCGLAVGAGLTTHLLRDASGGGCPWLWPFSSSLSVWWVCYPLGVMALALAVYWLTPRNSKR